MARTSSKPQQKRSKQENGRKSKKSSSKVTATGGGGRILVSKRRASLRKADNQRKAKQSGRAAQDLRLRGRTVQLVNSPRAGSSRRPSASASSRRGAAKASSAKSKATKRPRSASCSGSTKANPDSSRSVPDHDLELVPRRWDDDGRPIYTRRGRQLVMDMKTRMRNQAPELAERELRGGRIVITEKRKSGK
ncbi:uncharacterized protein [Branchiostoma lanceolatum]|uniref:uncharacterized protein n=1 Tax=Branchiostoma lanceolatum TaxID=7740 RepID=UPI003456EA16